MESQPKNSELRNNPENFHPCKCAKSSKSEAEQSESYSNCTHRSVHQMFWSSDQVIYLILLNIFIPSTTVTMPLTTPILRSATKWCFCLFDLILYVPSTIFQLNRDRSSRVEPVLS